MSWGDTVGKTVVLVEEDELCPPETEEPEIEEIGT